MPSVEAAAIATNPPEPQRCSRSGWPAPAASTGGRTRGSPARCAERECSAVLAFVKTAVAEECEGHRQDWGHGDGQLSEIGHELQQLREVGPAQTGVGNSVIAAANSPNRFMLNRPTAQLRRAQAVYPKYPTNANQAGQGREDFQIDEHSWSRPAKVGQAIVEIRRLRCVERDMGGQWNETEPPAGSRGIVRLMHAFLRVHVPREAHKR